jgi:signal transduction histidine kinase
MRRTALLLSAILIPAVAISLLVVRVVRQEHELAERRAAEERREALDQLRRELTARLQALRLEEVNRIIGESGRRLPPGSPIVFVAPVLDERLVLPWDDRLAAPAPSAAFARWQRDGESLEYRRGDAPAATVAYEKALASARTPFESCSARLWLGRSYEKAGLRAEAASSDRVALGQCWGVSDADGVPVALYAAGRMLARSPADADAAGYLVRTASARPWRSPNEALMLQALLRRMGGAAVDAPLRTLAVELRNIEQMSSLATHVPDHMAALQRASRSGPGDLSWMGYGAEPWLITVVSPTSFATPVMMAVSPRQLVPAGVVLRVAATAGTTPLGDGFVDLYAEWPPGRFATPPSVPAMLYGSMLVVVIGAALMAGYLLLRDVHRETEMAAMRSQFVASVSHELKTPLTSIRAHAETMLLGRTRDAESASEYLRTIVSESERLSRLVDSVLEFSRIEQGRKAYHFQATCLDDVVRAAARTMEYPLAQLGFTLTIGSDGSQPTVQADSEALTQAILNLLGNAMKYSGESRRIELRMGTRGDAAFVDVVDHGIGISRDDQSRIFERFHRVQSSETAGIAGTGLGLALALHVVEGHRGRIAVASEPGRGSTFSVLIPLQAVA